MFRYFDISIFQYLNQAGIPSPGQIPIRALCRSVGKEIQNILCNSLFPASFLSSVLRLLFLFLRDIFQPMEPSGWLRLENTFRLQAKLWLNSTTPTVGLYQAVFQD